MNSHQGWGASIFCSSVLKPASPSGNAFIPQETHWAGWSLWYKVSPTLYAWVSHHYCGWKTLGTYCWWFGRRTRNCCERFEPYTELASGHVISTNGRNPCGGRFKFKVDWQPRYFFTTLLFCQSTKTVRQTSEGFLTCGSKWHEMTSTWTTYSM